MEISAGAEHLDVNQQLKGLMDQALLLPEARDEISAKRMRIDVIGQTCTLPLDGIPDAVTVGRTFEAPGIPESTYVRIPLNPDNKRDENHFFEVRYLKGGTGPNIYIQNGKQVVRTVYAQEEKDMRLQLAMLTLDGTISEVNTRRSELQHDMYPEIKWKNDNQSRIGRLGSSVMRLFRRR